MNLLELSEQEIIRRNSMEQLRQMGIEPYPAAEFVTNAFSTEIKESFKDDAEPRPVRIAGRIMSRRIMGKASFMELQDSKGRIQVYISRDDVCPGENKDLYNIVFKKLLDIGDFVGIKGFVFRTQMGEISVHAEEITVLSKSLRPLPIVKYKDGVAYDDGTMVENKWIVVKGAETSGSNPQPEVVPTMQEWRGDDGGAFSLNENTRIIVSAEDMDVLDDAAEITRSDLEEMFGISAEITSDAPKAGDIVLALTESSIETEDEEIIELINQSYRMDVGEYVTVEGPAYKGVFFGTRSVLQALLTSGNDTIAYGTAVDYPNYPIRQFMLDVGRKYFPMWYLEDLVKYASWLKLTDFQCHLSEDTFNDYSAFRLESDIPHLTSTDGYYTKDEYREFQKHAENYGIRVITEIDGPAHARRFIELGSYEDAPDKYKNLGLDGTHFNLSEEGGARERVFNLMDEVLEEYLGGEDPVVITDAFNVGMDEYFGDQNDLRAYGVHMYDQVVNKYGKTAFGWDSNASLPNDVYTKEDYPIDDVRICYWKWEEVDGGVKALKALGAPFPQVTFIPTGGVDLNNLKEFLDCDKVYAVGGSFMMKGDITANCKEIVRICES